MSYPKGYEFGYDTSYSSLEKAEQEHFAGKKVVCAKIKMTEPYHRFTLTKPGRRPYFLCRASYEIIELYYQDPALNLSNGDTFDIHTSCPSTKIEEDILVPCLVPNTFWTEYGKEYLLLGYINEEDTESVSLVAEFSYLYEWDISREEEVEEREQYGLWPRNEDKFVIRDQIMEKYVN